MLQNFRVIHEIQSAEAYALAIGHFADPAARRRAVRAALAAQERELSRTEPAGTAALRPQRGFYRAPGAIPAARPGRACAAFQPRSGACGGFASSDMLRLPGTETAISRSNPVATFARALTGPPDDRFYGVGNLPACGLIPLL